MKLEAFVGKALKSLPYTKVKTENGEEVDLCRVSSENGCVEFVCFDAHTNYKPHVHDEPDSMIYVLAGTGDFLLDKDGVERRPYEPGSVLSAPHGVWHGFDVKGETVILSIQSKEILNKDTGKIDIRYE